LAKAQLEANRVKDSIASYIKGEDATNYNNVIKAARAANLYGDLITFLKMARSKVKEPALDNEIIYAYAKTERLNDLEEFIGGSHVAKLPEVADHLFAEGLFNAAKIIYGHTNNNAKLAICLVRLEQFQEAVDAARKANAIATWKAVCFACVDHDKFRLAQMCGINVIVYTDHLADLVKHYENGAHFEHAITLLEQGILSDRAHQGIFTALGILYCKYKEEKLMEHIKLFHNKVNIPILLKECQRNLHWVEAVFLYTHYDQFDNAINVLINHSAECWKHDLFKETIKKTSNTQMYYKAIDFYVEEHPTLLEDLLLDMVNILDHGRVVQTVKRHGHLALIKKYLNHVQRENIAPVNEAVNELLLNEEDYKGLRTSIDSFRAFDQIALAENLKNHELLEFRRLSAYLNKVNKRWKAALDLAKKDSLWKDATEIAAESKDTTVCEDLLRFFVEQKQYECFSAALYTCYELVKPDVVLELAWRNELFNYVMPYLIQTVKEFNENLEKVFKKFDQQEEVAEAKEAVHKKKLEEAVMIAAVQPTMLALPAPPMGGGFGGPSHGGGMGHMGGGFGGPSNGFFS